MWCTNAPNSDNMIEIFNDSNITCSQLLIYFSPLIRGVFPAFSTFLCCLLWLTVFFFFFSPPCSVGWRSETGAECCWALLGVWPPETKSNIPAILWWTSVLWGVGGDLFYPHQPCRGRAERVNVSLWWCTCSGKIVITNCELLFFYYLPKAALEHPTSWFLRSSFATYRSASKLVSLGRALPFFIHILHAKKGLAVCVHARQSEHTRL